MDFQEMIALLLLFLFGGGACSLGITLLILIFTIVPFALIGSYLYRRSKQAGNMRKASQTWLSTTGTIIKSRVEVRGGQHASVHPHIVYEYTVHGQTHHGEQIRAGDQYWVMQTSHDAYAAIDRYPVNATVTVYYDPANPEQSALER